MIASQVFFCLSVVQCSASTFCALFCAKDTFFLCSEVTAMREYRSNRCSGVMVMSLDRM